jgi:general secretion pathway protein G
MTASLRRRSGFTLIEILMVVVILGVLATVIIGLFNNTTSDASTGALKDDLRGIRSALQIYYAQHGSYPTLASFEAQMTKYSDASGATASAATTTFTFGPYLLHMPALPVGSNRGITTLTGTSYADGFGWQYDQTTGSFKANCADTESDGQGNFYHTF